MQVPHAYQRRPWPGRPGQRFTPRPGGIPWLASPPELDNHKYPVEGADGQRHAVENVLCPSLASDGECGVDDQATAQPASKRRGHTGRAVQCGAHELELWRQS
jgi:hypothetical protein